MKLIDDNGTTWDLKHNETNTGLIITNPQGDNHFANGQNSEILFARTLSHSGRLADEIVQLRNEIFRLERENITLRGIAYWNAHGKLLQE